MTKTLLPSQTDAFQREGYLIDRGVFSPSELSDLRALAERVQRKTRELLPPGTRYWFGGKDEGAVIPDALKPLATWGINEITRPSLFEPGLVNVFAHPRVHEMLHALLGPEPRAWGIKILWTPKVVGYDLHWHRDLSEALYDVVPNKPRAQDHVQFNAALNVDDCFLVIPGSHRRPLTEQEWTSVRQRSTAKLPGEVTTALEPGDILYMDAHTLHRGRSSVEGDRLTLHYSAQAQWVPLKEWGDPDDFAWISSDSFQDQLEPNARPLYARLRTAVRTDEAGIHNKEPTRYGD
ncbi:MAG: phytanoyl-CoA dioxygenase family protein [Cytophagales bacterium]|nr:phytanoyl-CoA dioxygenase family protein [Armatimonadota bacterium]